MKYDPLEIQKELKILYEEARVLNDKIDPLRGAKIKINQKIGRLETMLDSMQSICLHDTRTEYLSGYRDHDVIMVCNDCGHEKYMS